MREIKFRGWDEGNQIMHDNVQFMRSGTDGNDWILFSSETRPIHSAINDPFFCQQIKIMQYTGLKDRNGKEIYEGDIIQSWYSRDTSGLDIINHTEPVEFEVNEHLGKSGFEIPFLNHAIVFGNIYENPDLLNSDKNDETSVATEDEQSSKP